MRVSAIALVCASVLAVGVGLSRSDFAHAQEEARPVASVGVVKMCGSIEKAETQFDGLQTVFTRTLNGQPISSYFLQAVSPNAETQIAEIPENQPEDACVVGVPSQLMKIDSPQEFYTFEILWLQP